MKLSPLVGLCARCKHVHVVKSARGSFFVLCNRAKTDARLPKYPELPVLHCPGYEPVTGPGPAETPA